VWLVVWAAVARQIAACAETAVLAGATDCRREKQALALVIAVPAKAGDLWTSRA
jgi:hypothetical protein